MPRTSSSSHRTPLSQLPIRPPVIMGPSMPTQSYQTGSPSFTQSVKEGFSLGIGVSVANKLVNKVFGDSSNSTPTTPTIPITQPTQLNSCSELLNAYTKCDSTEKCSKLFEEYQKCKEKQS